jgi:hypothetical protein
MGMNIVVSLLFGYLFVGLRILLGIPEFIYFRYRKNDFLYGSVLFLIVLSVVFDLIKLSFIYYIYLVPSSCLIQLYADFRLHKGIESHSPKWFKEVVLFTDMLLGFWFFFNLGIITRV